MGEVAEMMLDGTLCEGCGCALHGFGEGFPRRCKSCRTDQNIARMQAEHAAAKKVKCGTCGKRVKAVGLADHMRDAHKVLTLTQLQRDEDHSDSAWCLPSDMGAR